MTGNEPLLSVYHLLTGKNIIVITLIVSCVSLCMCMVRTDISLSKARKVFFHFKSNMKTSAISYSFLLFLTFGVIECRKDKTKQLLREAEAVNTVHHEDRKKKMLESAALKNRVVPTGFSLGRIDSRYFYYDNLGGKMKTREAVDFCEKDLACGGFTFKGCLKELNDDEVRRFYFFRFAHLSTVRNEEDLIWITYRVKRPFLLFKGQLSLAKKLKPNAEAFQLTSSLTTKLNSNGEEIKKWPFSPSIPAFSVDIDDYNHMTGLSVFDSANLEPSDSYVTIMKNNGTFKNPMIGDMISELFSKDFCCSIKSDFYDYFSDGNFLPVQSYDCKSMSTDDFEEKFVRLQTPVILKGCVHAGDEPGLTVSRLWHRSDKLWRGKYFSVASPNHLIEVNGKLPNPASDNLGSIRFNLLSEGNSTFKWMLHPRDIESETNQEANRPPLTRLLSAGSGIPLREYVTDSMLTIQSGRIWVIVLPKDVPLKDLPKCKSRCSSFSAESPLASFQWVSSVLPQALHRDYFGQRMRLANLEAGEMAFLPSGSIWMSYAWEDTVTIEQSFLSREAAAERPLSDFNNLRITPNDLEDVIKERESAKEQVRRNLHLLPEDDIGPGTIVW